MNSQHWLSAAEPLKWKHIFEVFQERADSMELLVESIHSDAGFKGKFVKNKHGGFCVKSLTKELQLKPNSCFVLTSNLVLIITVQQWLKPLEKG